VICGKTIYGIPIFEFELEKFRYSKNEMCECWVGNSDFGKNSGDFWKLMNFL